MALESLGAYLEFNIHPGVDNMRQASNAFDTLNKKTEQAKAPTSGLSKSFENLTDRAGLAGLEMRSFAEEIGSTNGLTSQFSRNMRSAGNHLKSVGYGLIAAGLALSPFVALLASAAKEAANFQDALAGIQSLSTRANESNTDLSLGIRQTALQSKFTANQVAESAKVYRKAGISQENTMAALSATANAAAVDQTSMATAASANARIITALGLKGEETAGTISKLQIAATSANTSISELGQAAGYVSGTVRSLNIDHNDMIAILAGTSNAMKSGSRAGTSMNAMLDSLSAPSRKASKMLKELNFMWAINEDGTVNLGRTLDDLSQKLDKKFPNAIERTAAKAAIFNVRAKRSADAAFTEMRNSITTISKLISDSGNATERAAMQAEARMNSFEQQWKLLVSAFQEVSISLFSEPFKDLLPVMKFVVRGSQELASALLYLSRPADTSVEKTKELKKAYDKVSGPIKGFANGLLLVFRTVAWVADKVIKGVVVFFYVLGRALGKIGMAIVGGLVASLTVAAAALSIFLIALGGLVVGLGTVAVAIGSVKLALWVIPLMVGFIKASFLGLAKLLVTKVVTALWALIPPLLSFLAWAWPVLALLAGAIALWKTFGDEGEGFFDFLTRSFKEFGAMLEEYGYGMVRYFSKIYGWIMQLVNDPIEAFKKMQGKTLLESVGLKSWNPLDEMNFTRAIVRSDKELAAEKAMEAKNEKDKQDKQDEKGFLEGLFDELKKTITDASEKEKNITFHAPKLQLDGDSVSKALGKRKQEAEERAGRAVLWQRTLAQEFGVPVK